MSACWRRGGPGRLALAGLAASLLGACSPVARQAAPRVLPVQVEPVAAELFSDSVDTVSTLEAVDEVRLAAQASGRIERLLVRQGDAVGKGQLLLVLDQTQLRADVARLEAEVQNHRLNFSRYEYLVRQGAASAFQRDQFRQQYLSARQELIARRADLAFRDLRAPVSGIITDVPVNEGDMIQAGAPFTRILRNARLQARVEVPAIHAGRVREGLPVILIDPISGRPIARAPLASIDPGVVAGSQTLLAKAEFANPGGQLRHGLRLRTRLILEQRRQPSVPFAAVTRLAGQSFVFVPGSLAELQARPGRADLAALRRLPPGTTVALQTPVQLGPLQGDRYPVLRGLPATASVITSNLIGLRHGSPVKPRRQP